MGKQWKQWQTLFSWAPTLLQMVTAAMKLKDLLLGRKAMTNLDSILKSRDFANKGPSNQSYGFSSSYVWMWTAAAAKLLQSCLTPCDPIEGSPPRFPIPGILQQEHQSGLPFPFPMSQFFASGGQSIGVSASASVLPMNIQDWFPLGLTGWISWQSKGLSRVFSNTTVQKHQFFSANPSLWSNSHIHI